MSAFGRFGECVSTLKQQYAGDVSDYRKFDLLRRLSAGGRIRIGVCWMLTPPDGRPDGDKIQYLERDDRDELASLLHAARHGPAHARLASLERSRPIPGAIYFDEYVPRRPGLRRSYFEAMLAEFRSTQLVFFDPDNGIDVSSVPIGSREANKFAFRHEIKATYDAGHSVLLYQHFRRENRAKFIAGLAEEMSTLLGGARAIAYPSAHTLFLLLVRPEHETTVGRAGDATRAIWS